MRLFTVVLRSDSREYFREWPILSRLEISLRMFFYRRLCTTTMTVLECISSTHGAFHLVKNKVEATSGTQETHPTSLCPQNKRSRSSLIDWEELWLRIGIHPI